MTGLDKVELLQMALLIVPLAAMTLLLIVLLVS